jgi:hypothetical protein
MFGVCVYSVFVLSGQRHELSSLSRKPGLWVRIPLKEWMFGVYVYSVFVLSCVWVTALRRADHSSKVSNRL